VLGSGFRFGDSGAGHANRVEHAETGTPTFTRAVQGYLTHKKQPPLIGPSKDPRYSSTAGA
jgi:hypothetical protein